MPHKCNTSSNPSYSIKLQYATAHASWAVFDQSPIVSFCLTALFVTESVQLIRSPEIHRALVFKVFWDPITMCHFLYGCCAEKHLNVQEASESDQCLSCPNQIKGRVGVEWRKQLVHCGWSHWPGNWLNMQLLLMSVLAAGFGKQTQHITILYIHFINL